MTNLHLINVFERLVLEKKTKIENLKKEKEKNKKEITGLRFKIINFNKAIVAIKNYPNKINKGEDLKDIKGIGKGIIDRINEILVEGTLKNEIKESNSLNKKINELKNLETITGIGPAKSKDLFDKGITLDILKKELDKLDKDLRLVKEKSILSNLTHHQLVGLKYLDDINKQIPRKEILNVRIKLIRFIGQLDPKFEIMVCGSFRRKKETSGDIDVLILHPEYPTLKSIKDSGEKILVEIISYLIKKKLVVDSLTEEGNTKFMGICKATKSGLGRRIDVRFIAYESKGAAMLYFTGSGNFNKVMRADALKKGYTINEYGIYKLNKLKGKTEKELIKTETEEDIFKIIDMEYLEPKDRI